MTTDPKPMMRPARVTIAALALAVLAGCAADGTKNPFSGMSFPGTGNTAEAEAPAPAPGPSRRPTSAPAPSPSRPNAAPQTSVFEVGQAVCLAISAMGGFDRAVKPLVEYHRKRGMTAAKLKQVERGYAVTLGLVGCYGIPYFAKSIYGKLSESGRKDRERALTAAAASGKPQVYRDPVSGVEGAVKPQETYDVAGTNEECRVQEDTATLSKAKENIMVTFCRVKPDGGWQEKRTVAFG